MLIRNLFNINKILKLNKNINNNNNNNNNILKILKRNLFIETESTPNPNAIKFLPGKEVLPEKYGTGVEFLKSQYKESQNSPLALTLFELDGILGIYYGKDFISITKSPEMSWNIIKPQIFSIIFDYFTDDKPVILDKPKERDTTINENDSEIVIAIKQLLEEKIRPYVQDDGGDIFFIRFDEESGVVYVRLAGSCVGCPSSSVTLRHGVENMLKHYVDEVTGIVNVTDDPNYKDNDTDNNNNNNNEIKVKEDTRIMQFTPTTTIDK